ncbi:hypothetical protein F443_06951 [Phytophthora nicotianae P1569]|uniref:Uncharacterized protein n=1 Tax=Phytophthora nicotianae P1569 TaxID=1317065 RepID=V9FFB1_PHYNI|nr:hypothetical protein F443_06951 [Phytophthora nicotianae P1569]
MMHPRCHPWRSIEQIEEDDQEGQRTEEAMPALPTSGRQQQQTVLRSKIEQVLSTVLPDPTPADMTIRVTLKSLNAFFDYTNPRHPWQVDRQLLHEDPFFFSMEGFDPLAPVPKQAPPENRIHRLWASFRADGPMPDLAFTLWERRFWILAATVEKGFTAEEAEPNRDKDLIKAKSARFIVLMSGPSAWADPLRNMYQLQYLKWSLESALAHHCSLICPEMIIEPSVPWYSVDNLPFVPRRTDCFAEVPVLVDRQSFHRYLPGPVFGDSTVAFSTTGCADDDSSAPTPPSAAHTSPPDEEEKEGDGDTSLGVLAEVAG